MKKVLYFILILCIVSCSSDKLVQLSFNELCSQLIEKKQAINYTIDTDIFSVDSLCIANDSKSIVYVMNASCSICIYQFVDFYYNNLQYLNQPIVVVVESDLKPQAEFFLEKAKIYPDSKNLILVDNNKKVIKGNIENLDLNGLVVLLNSKKIENSFQYIGQSDLFEE